MLNAEKLPKVTDFLREIGKNLAKMAVLSTKIFGIVSIKCERELKMFKIKDDINLKELEKFGYYENKPFNYIKALVDTEIRYDAIVVNIKTKKIERIIKEIYMKEIKCKKVCKKYIQDLIQAGLVEKVEDDN